MLYLSDLLCLRADTVLSLQFCLEANPKTIIVSKNFNWLSFISHYSYYTNNIEYGIKTIINSANTLIRDYAIIYPLHLN